MGLIGSSQQRVDALSKARGEHLYPSDHVRPDVLWLRLARAPVAHARIRALDVSKAAALEGVVRVFTAADIPGTNAFGLIIADQPALCADRVRHAGEPVALIAARSDRIARQACDLVEVDYEPLEVVTDAARAESALALHPGGNLCAAINLGFGDPEATAADCPKVVEYSYVTNRQEHAFLETEAGTSWIDAAGVLNLSVGGQNPFHDRRQVAAVLGIDEQQVRVLNPMMGGAFGGKEDCSVQLHLALATWLTRLPARMMFDRAESIRTGVKRHSFAINIRVGATEDGTLHSFASELVADAGAYTTLSPAVLGQAAEHVSGPYVYEASRIDARAVFTNNGNASAYRGFGGPQITIGIEQVMDEMARACGLSPFDLRRRNLIGKGDRAGAGHVMSADTALLQMLDAAEAGALWRGREVFRGAATPWTRRGIGVTAVWQGYGLGADMERGAEVRISLTREGRYRLEVGTPDLGSGNLTAFLQIAAEGLSTTVDQFEYVVGDSLGPDSGSSHASRTIYVVGNAVARAARELADRITASAGGEGAALRRDHVRVDGGSIPLSEVHARIPDPEVRLHYHPPSAKPIHAGIPHAGYGYWVQVLGAEVDLLTGEVSVLEVENYVDTGHTINPTSVTGQCEGAFAQGLGYALYENAIYRDGVMLNPTFSGYIIPSIKDMPPKMTTRLFETPDECNPLGVRGIAEIGLTPVAASVANAIRDAIGARFSTFPILPEMVLSTFAAKEV